MLRFTQAAFLSVALLFTLACDGHAQSIPACLAKELSAADKGASVEPYLYNDKKVYSLQPGPHCADCYTKIVDENCQTICNLGGFTGKGDGKCADFGDKAKRDVPADSQDQ